MANNPKHMDNLKKIPKGVSGNPKGRPKLPDLKDLIEELGDDGMKAVIEALHKQAKKGNVKAIETLLDRYYGKVKQEVDNKNTNINYNAEVSKKEAKDISDALEDEV